MNKIDIEVRILELEELMTSECTHDQFLNYCDEYDGLITFLETEEND